MSPVSKRASQLNGIAAVHLAAAELSLRGYAVAVTARNTAGIDLFASSPRSGRTYGIQVKSNRLYDRPRSSFWLLGTNPVKSSPTYFFIFVDIHDPPAPNEFFVVMSSVVAKNSSRRRAEWNSFYRNAADPYIGRWDLLK